MVNYNSLSYSLLGSSHGLVPFKFMMNHPSSTCPIQKTFIGDSRYSKDNDLNNTLSIQNKGT